MDVRYVTLLRRNAKRLLAELIVPEIKHVLVQKIVVLHVILQRENARHQHAELHVQIIKPVLVH